jgi:ADP-heptose:LPS heptosyltransferase
VRILIVRNDKLGDFVTALPVFYLLKQYREDITTIACVAPMNAQFARDIDFIDEVIVDSGNTLNMAHQFSKAKIDVAIALFSSTHMALALLLGGVKRRIAPATKIAQIFYNDRVIQRRSRVEKSEYAYNIDLALHLFPTMETVLPTPLVPFEEKRTSTVAFHVGFGGSSDANLTIEEYVQLALVVLGLAKYEVVFTFGPGEDGLQKEVYKHLGDQVTYYFSKGTIFEFARYLSSLRLFCSTSTGTYHVASMVGTPTLTFFADTLFASSARWESIGDKALQMNRMVPLDMALRQQFLEKVKSDLEQTLRTSNE